MKAENLLKLTESEEIKKFIPGFSVIQTISELYKEASITIINNSHKIEETIYLVVKK